MQEETADKLNAVPGLLKAFVILGGILLLFGVITLAAMIMLRATPGDLPEEAALPAAQVDVPLPAGMRVREVVADGRRLVLLGEDEAGQQYIAVVDAQTGVRESLIRLAPAQ